MKSIFTPGFGLTDDIRVKAVRDALFTSVSRSAIKHNVGKTTIRNWMQRIPACMLMQASGRVSARSTVSYLLESERKKEK